MLSRQIKLARLRRDLPAQLVAERAGISRASLWKVESGNPAVAMGIYAAVLHALNNMDQDLLLVAKDDDFGFNEPIMLGRLYVSVIKGGERNFAKKIS